MAMPSVQPRYCFIKKGVVKSGQAHATSIKPANFVDLGSSRYVVHADRNASESYRDLCKLKVIDLHFNFLQKRITTGSIFECNSHACTPPSSQLEELRAS